MLKLNWHEPNFIKQGNFSLASDTSTVNLYILRKKYRLEVAKWEGGIFRRYNGTNINRRGYGFPLFDKDFDLNAAIELLKADSVMRGENLRFCLCNEDQRAEIDKIIAVDWHSFDGDSDYIYKREELAQLSGNKFHHKRTLFNKFMRTCPDAKYLPLTVKNLPDALQVVEKWFVEKYDGSISLQFELESIQEATDNLENLGMQGGILYVNDEPAAMTMFSVLNEQCLDVHCEKATNKFAANGATVAIRKFMASAEENSAYEYINWEEDLGILNLRHAKEISRPIFKLKKYYGEVFK